MAAEEKQGWGEGMRDLAWRPRAARTAVPPSTPRSSTQEPGNPPWYDDPFTRHVLAATRRIRRRERLRRRLVPAILGTTALAASVVLGGVLMLPPRALDPAQVLRSRATSRGYDPAPRTITSIREGTKALAAALPPGTSSSTFLRDVRRDPQAALTSLLSIEDPKARHAIPEIVAGTLAHSPSRGESLPFLRACLDAEDPDVVRSAVRGMAAVCSDPGKDCQEVLRDLLFHPDAGVRALAERLLAGS